MTAEKGLPRFFPLRRLLPRGPAAVLAVLVSLAAVVVQAEIIRPDWLPEEIVLPADAELVADRAIGSSLRMFSITTSADSAELLAAWQEALELGPYTVRTGQEASIVDAIEFTGPGIGNAKITASESSAEVRTLLEFDATLD